VSVGGGGSAGARRGRVVLVGAGPGDPDLITVRGAEVLRRADVVVYDSLVAHELLALARPDAERIDVGKRGHEDPTRAQQEIQALLVARARAGHLVVRLKGGDPFVYGRGGEEASACRAARIPFEVVPGVTSALSGPAFAGIPITDRRHGASFAVVTGHRDAARPWTSIRWDRLATAVDTLVVLMGMRNLDKIAAALIAEGRAADTPVAVVMEAATARQRVVVAPLAEIAERARSAGLAAPAVVVVGDVVRLRDELAWFDTAPLFGRRVLVTRPAEQAGELAALLRAAGAEPVRVPMIRVVATQDGAGVAAALGALADYDALLFTSANAVRAFASALAAAGYAPAAAPRALCVGPATAQAAREAGFADVEAPSPRADAESLLAALRTRAPAGARFLFVRGVQARTVLPDGLRAAGACVDEAVVYRTEPAALDEAGLRAALVRGELDALTFASASAARRFAALLDEPARRAAAAAVVAAIGGTTAAALREAGLPPSVEAAQADMPSLVDALAEAFAGPARRGGPG
jgi:uroporphyrinogen III methyltransferase/synthase